MDETQAPKAVVIPGGMSEREEKASLQNNLYAIYGTFPYQALSQHRVYGKTLDEKRDRRVLGYNAYWNPFGYFFDLIEEGKLDGDPFHQLTINQRQPPPQQWSWNLNQLRTPFNFFGEGFEIFDNGELPDEGDAGNFVDYSPDF